MSDLDVAAGVTTVLQLSGKVASLCVSYLKEVKQSGQHIRKLSSEATRLTTTLQRVGELISQPKNAKLQTLHDISAALSDGETQLQRLVHKLHRQETNRTRTQALKWPFQKEELDKAISDLRQCREMISFALQIDQVCVCASYLAVAVELTAYI